MRKSPITELMKSDPLFSRVLILQTLLKQEINLTKKLAEALRHKTTFNKELKKEKKEVEDELLNTYKLLDKAENQIQSLKQKIFYLKKEKK